MHVDDHLVVVAQVDRTTTVARCRCSSGSAVIAADAHLVGTIHLVVTMVVVATHVSRLVATVASVGGRDRFDGGAVAAVVVVGGSAFLVLAMKRGFVMTSVELEIVIVDVTLHLASTDRRRIFVVVVVFELGLIEAERGQLHHTIRMIGAMVRRIILVVVRSLTAIKIINEIKKFKEI